MLFPSTRDSHDIICPPPQEPHNISFHPHGLHGNPVIPIPVQVSGWDGTGSIVVENASVFFLIEVHQLPSATAWG